MMTVMQDISEQVELAFMGGLPQETINAAAKAAVTLHAGEVADLRRVSFGNSTAAHIVISPLEKDVLVSIVGWGAYPFDLDGAYPLHYSYVGEKLTRHNDCDAVALTLLLGIALRRPAVVRGGCSCPAHREVCGDA